MKRQIVILIFALLLSGCRDKMNDPVGLDEVPKDIPQPCYVDGILADSVSNFHLEGNTGSSDRLWIGFSNYIESRILVRFEVEDSTILANADSAKVTLTVYDTPTKYVSFSVFPLTAIWDETTVGWERSSSDSEWNNPGADYDTTRITTIVINEDEEEFTFDCDEFSLLDSSFTENSGMIFVYEMGDTILAICSKESSANSLNMTLFYGDSTKDYLPEIDAFIVNSEYVPGNDEIFLGEGYAMRALLIFDIDSIPQDVTVNRAYLKFAFKPENSYLDSVDVSIHKVTGEWNDEETDFFSVSTEDFTVHQDDTLSSEIDITSLVQYWVNGGENMGILLKTSNEGSSCSRLVFDAGATLSVYYTPAPE